MKSKTTCDPVVGEPAMTEQPPPSAEALMLATRIRDRYHAPGNEHVLELSDAAIEIDRFAARVCEQRVSAEIRRCALVAGYYEDHEDCEHEAGYKDGRLDAMSAVLARAPDERPAPPQQPASALGIPIIADSSLPPGTAEMRSGNSVVRMTNLDSSVPSALASTGEQPDCETVAALLSCPFCGSIDLHQIYEDTVRKWGCITCFGCGAKGGDVQTGYGPEEEWREDAAAQWNRRVAPPTGTGEQPDCGVGWRPVESAPKDGTRLLTWQPSPASSHEAILRLDPRRNLWLDDHDSWFVVAPTYWQPLPSPPTDAGGISSTGTEEER